jgi:phosphate starvation-inducible PhoH-like protein
VSASAAATHEFALEPADNARLASLCGPLDENLRLIESRLGVKIRRRGQSFRVQGEQAETVEAAEDVLKDLYAQARHRDLSGEQVHLCLVEHASGGQGDAADAVIVAAGDAERGAAGRRESVRARGAHQRDYLAHIRNHDLSFGVGPAGTGKTYLAVACAVEALLSERVRRIVLVRPAVEAGERLGFLPGDMAQKVDPYLRPMYDALYELMGFDRVARFIERNAIEVAPLAFMRGRSLNESFIILDEAQNTTIEQMKMFLTRIGFGSRAVVTGDLTQTDLPSGRMSGLQHAQLILRGVAGGGGHLVGARGGVGHPLVQRIVQAYESHERANQP